MIFAAVGQCMTRSYNCPPPMVFLPCTSSVFIRLGGGGGGGGLSSVRVEVSNSWCGRDTIPSFQGMKSPYEVSGLINGKNDTLVLFYR